MPKTAFDVSEQLLIKAAQAVPPNYSLLQSLINRCDDINVMLDTEDHETLLSEIIQNYACFLDKDLQANIGGKYLPEICRFFLQNGYDVHGCNGIAGGVCLQNLTWSCDDRYILDAAKVLLDAGADPNFQTTDGDTLLYLLAEKSYFLDVCENDEESYLLYESYYQLLKAAVEGRDYHSIELLSST